MQKMHVKSWLVWCCTVLCLMVWSLSGVADVDLKSTSRINQLKPKHLMSDHTDTLRALMVDLYTRHPNQLAKSTSVGPREMSEWVFEGKANWKFESLRQRQGEQALSLLMESNYTGDAILPLVVGLETMIFQAYGADNEFSIPSTVEPKTIHSLVCRIHYWQSTLPTASALQAIYHDQASALMVHHTFDHLLKQLSQWPVPREPCE